MSCNCDGLGHMTFIMAAASVLKGKSPLNQAVQRTAAGWLCICGTYHIMSERYMYYDIFVRSFHCCFLQQFQGMKGKQWSLFCFFLFFFLNMLKSFPSSSFLSSCLPAISSSLLLCQISTLKTIFTGRSFSSHIVLSVGMSHKHKEFENDPSTSYWLIGDFKRQWKVKIQRDTRPSFKAK